MIGFIHRRSEDRDRRVSLGAALLGSLALHLMILMAWDTGRRLGIWQTRTQVTSPTKRAPLREIVIDLRKEVPPPKTESPMTFVDVPASQATPEAPDKAEFYSAKNSRAANPDISENTPVPKIDGKQEVVPKTTDVPRRVEPVPAETETSPPPPPAPIVEKRPSPPAPVEKIEVRPTPPDIAGDVPKPLPKQDPEPEIKPVVKVIEDPVPAPPKPLVPEPPPRAPEVVEPKPKVVLPQSPRKRPRTLAQVQPDPDTSVLPGEKMRQSGGVGRFGMESSFDVRSTEFGAYDQAIVAAIQKRWYDLLDAREIARSHKGRVVLVFRLYSDGRIADMNERENEVTALLGLMCRRAVEDPSPYAPWPSDLRRLVGRDFREVRFVFHYN